MKGLLRSHFFAASSNAKVFAVFMFLWGIYTAKSTGTPIVIGYSLSGMVGFSINGILSIQRESSSGWGKYQLILPVRRTDIVRSHYISQLAWLLVGVLFVSAVICLAWPYHGWPFDLYIDVLAVFAIGISTSLFTCAIFFPLFYWIGEERGEAFLVISLLCGIAVDIGLIMLLNMLLTKPGTAAKLFGYTAMIACSALLYTLSYLLTVGIYRRKEL